MKEPSNYNKYHENSKTIALIGGIIIALAGIYRFTRKSQPRVRLISPPA
ncbi:MAG TPA: hypothetical protein VKB19_18365 [Pedobacter sp.]|nr:hypothetical protein [Pedobacter sp.]